MRKIKPLFIILIVLIISVLIYSTVVSSDIMKTSVTGSIKETAADDVTDIQEELSMTADQSFGQDAESYPAASAVSDDTQKSQPADEAVPDNASALKDPVFEEYDIPLLMVGDNLYHYGVINEGKKEDGTLNYDFEFDGITDLLNLADIKMINQETPFGGNDKPFIAYPLFNTPEEVGDAIAKAGFNVMLTATNHAGDMGEEGLYNYYHYMHDNFPEVLVPGIHGEDISSRLPNTVTGEESVMIISALDEILMDLSPEEAANYVIIDSSKDYSRINLLKIKGYTFAFLNYTYGNNYETFFKWQEGRLDFLCTFDPKTRYINMRELNPQVTEDIRLARTIADVVVVCPHWGIEYRTTPTIYQTSWAKAMAEAGADLIIGTHPHVPEPLEWITTEEGKEVLCYYSLGNYASTQNQSVDVLLEELAWVSFHVREDGISLSKEESGIVPLVNHYTYGPLRFKKAYLLEDYTPELASLHGVARHGEFSLQYEDLWKRAGEIFEDHILTRHQIYSQFETDDP